MKIDLWALTRLNVPERCWNASYTGLTQTLQTPVRNYCQKMPEMLRRGTGFYIHGPSGSGKTCGGVVLLKAAVERDHWGYYTTVKDLRQAIREEWTFDGSQSVLSRCKDVDVLVLDDLAQDDFRNFTFGIGEVEHLLSIRASRAKTTVLATRLTPHDLRMEYPSLLATMQGSFLSVSCAENNLKAEASEQLRRDLTGA